MHNNLGIELKEAEKYEEAIRHYHAALRLKQDDINAHLNLGLVLYETERYEEAVRHYRTALRLQPDKEGGDYVSACNNMGAALMKQGEIDPAVQAFCNVLEIEPDNIDANYNLGVALMARQDYHRAFDLFSRVLDIIPGHEPAGRERKYCRKMINITSGVSNNSAGP